MSETQLSLPAQPSQSAISPNANKAADPVPVAPVELQQAARDHAVAAMVTGAMAHAGTLRLSAEEQALLLSPFPDSDFQTGASGKENLIYIEHAALRNRLNAALGLGQWSMVVRESWKEEFQVWNKMARKNVPCMRVYARVMLVVRGCYVGEAVGDMAYFPHNPATNFGDAFEGAKTAAFRRCAKEFGIGLQAWSKDWCAGWHARRAGGGSRTRQAAPAQQEAAHTFDPGDESFPIDNESAPDFGPESPADDVAPATAGDLTENYDEIEIKMVKAATGRGPRKLFAKDGGIIFDLWPKDVALCNAFDKAWMPPASKRLFHIECLLERNGEYVNRKVLLMEPV